MGIYFNPFYVLVFVLIKHQESCGWALPLLLLVTNSGGAVAKSGRPCGHWHAFTNWFCLISSFVEPLPDLLAFISAPLKALPSVLWSHCLPDMKGTSVGQKHNYIKWNWKRKSEPPMENEFTLCTATLGLKRKTAFFFLLPFFPNQESACVKGKWNRLPMGTVLWAVNSSQEKAAPGAGPSCGGVFLTASLGMWLFRVEWPLGTMSGVEGLSGKAQ